MSSSPVRSSSQTETAQPFPYLDIASGNASPPPEVSAVRASEGEVAVREQAARLAGQKEGEGQAREAFARQIEQQREALRIALTDFAAERRGYYRRVESEVVQLAVNIARSIMHREIQIDPLLLAGMVRVALEKIESGSKVVLRVHPERAEQWRVYFEHKVSGGDVPDVLEDPAIDPDRCVIQTSLGTTELGVMPQLKEIEQGLLDLVAKCPRSGE